MADLTDDLSALTIDRSTDVRGPDRRVVVWVLLLLVLAGGGGAIWWWLTRERPVEVQVAPVTARAAGMQAAVLNASGYVTARRRATVSSKITGKVVEVNVEEGMAVRLEEAKPAGDGPPPVSAETRTAVDPKEARR